jgi:hypothetical protein
MNNTDLKMLLFFSREYGISRPSLSFLMALMDWEVGSAGTGTTIGSFWPYIHESDIKKDVK